MCFLCRYHLPNIFWQLVPADAQFQRNWELLQSRVRLKRMVSILGKQPCMGTFLNFRLCIFNDQGDSQSTAFLETTICLRPHWPVFVKVQIEVTMSAGKESLGFPKSSWNSALMCGLRFGNTTQQWLWHKWCSGSGAGRTSMQQIAAQHIIVECASLHPSPELTNG